jgi:hypothetical protein
MLVGLAASAASAAAAPVALRAGRVTYLVEPATLKIDARPDGAAPLAVMPPLHAPEPAAVTPDGAGWRWTDAEGRQVSLSTEGEALRLVITGAKGSKLAWPLPPATTGTWLIPDGEGLAYKADDPFWRTAHKGEKCLGGTSLLSFPAWSYLTKTHAVTYALGDGLLSKLCLRDQDGLQARLRRDFAEGAETLDLLFAIRPAEPLAPALFYRQVLKGRGQLKSFADKAAPGLPRLFGAPQAYVWGDGRDLAFLDDLKALGVDRIVLSYDQDPRTQKHVVGPAYLAKASALGYLAGPYEAFDNGQPEATADMPSAIWGDLYPSGCLRDAGGQVVTGFASRGCAMSSEAIARHPGSPSPASRYAGHIADGASQVSWTSTPSASSLRTTVPIIRCPWPATASTGWRAWEWRSTGSTWCWAPRTSPPGAAASRTIPTARPRPTPRRSGRCWATRNASAATGRPTARTCFSRRSSRPPTRRGRCSGPPTACLCSKRCSTTPSSPPTAGSLG